MPVFIEWLEGGVLHRGILKKEDKARLQVVSLSGKTLAVPSKRFMIRHQGTGEGLDFFKSIDKRASEVDLELLHETVGGGGTFTAGELAAFWFSSDGSSMEDASILLSACLKGAPWFKVDGAGRVHSASAEALERMRREKEAKDRLEAETCTLVALLHDEADAGEEERTARIGDSLLARFLGEHSPDDWPALAGALQSATGGDDRAVPGIIQAFLERAGKLPEPYRVHMARFHRSFFGAPLPEEGIAPSQDRYPEAPAAEIEQVASRARSLLETLPPPLHHRVFSVDDAGVEEIDDAVSAEVLGKDRFRVGVHIAAPGLVIPEESIIHARASSQCITVYQPDLKWTMLPRKIIEAFSLRAGERLPAISTYFTFAREGFDLLETEVRAEALAPTGNFSYRAIEACLEGGFFPDLEHLDTDPDRVYGWMDQDPNDFPWAKKSGLPPAVEDALDLLVPLARHLFVARNREGARLFSRTEYRIKVSPAGEITVHERKRNGLIEGVVAELMILTNQGTAARLADVQMPAIYRTQRQISTGARTYRTRADLTVVPREHAGLGSSVYCWATSPLRRYADLLNQRQLASLIHGSLPAFGDPSELLVRAKKTEFQNKTADQHQDRMERYWTLKFLEKQGEAPQAVELVLRRGTWVVRFTKLPLEEILDPRKCGDLSEGPAVFVPERFDFYGLRVEGRIESA